jgi:hypothetical protein
MLMAMAERAFWLSCIDTMFLRSMIEIDFFLFVKMRKKKVMV